VPQKSNNIIIRSHFLPSHTLHVIICWHVRRNKAERFWRSV